MSFEDEVKNELRKKGKDPVLECLKILSGKDEDYARLRNGEGFNEKDTKIGNALAELDSLGPNQFDKGKKLIKKYEGQLPPKLYLEAIDASWADYYEKTSPRADLKGEEIEVEGIKITIPMAVNKKGEMVYDLHELAKELKEKLNLEYLKDRKSRAIALVRYDPNNGTYGKDGEDWVSHVLEQGLGNSAIINMKNEVIRHLKDLGFQYLDNWQSKSNPHIAVSNGVINLEKYVNGDVDSCLEAFSPKYHSFSKLDAEFDPRAPQDLLTNHLGLVIPDTSDRDRFQKFVGSFLEENGYGHQKILILFGKSGAGKTITLRIFTKFFGIENISAKSFQQLTEDRFAMADLFGTLANIVEELPQDAVRYLQRLNSLTGGYVDAQKKGRDPFSFYQNAKICAACNDLPEVSSNTETILAFMSRLIIIVFKLTIRGTETEVQNYDDVILSQKSGVLNWVLEGFRNYLLAEKKISNSKSTDDTLEFYAMNSDFLAYFADGCFEKGDSEKDHVIKDKMWDAYVKAAKMKNAPTQSKQTVKDKFPTKTKYHIIDDRITVNGEQKHVWRGIRLKDEAHWFKKQEDKGENKATKEDVISRLTEYLKSSPDRVETISKIFELGTKEWYPNISGLEFQELVEEIREGNGFYFDYGTQNVSLAEDKK